MLGSEMWASRDKFLFLWTSAPVSPPVLSQASRWASAEKAEAVNPLNEVSAFE